EGHERGRNQAARRSIHHITSGCGRGGNDRFERNRGHLAAGATASIKVVNPVLLLAIAATRCSARRAHVRLAARDTSGRPKLSTASTSVVFLHDARRLFAPHVARIVPSLFAEQGVSPMTGDYLTRSLRVLVIATLCSTGSVLTLWADPITVTSGHFDFGRGPAFEASFTFSGRDGFFLIEFAVLISDFSQTSRPTGCLPGDILNLSLRAGAESG